MLCVRVKTNAQALRVFDACYGHGVCLWDTWPGALPGRVLWIMKPFEGLREAMAQALPDATIWES